MEIGGVCQDETDSVVSLSTVFGMTSTKIIHGRIDFNLPSASGRLQQLLPASRKTTRSL
jgi:hypothetical protein